MRWRVFHDIAPLGRLGVDDLVSDRRDEAAVVAFTVTLPKAARAALYYGASAPSALSLNGRWVAFDSQQHAEHFGQLRVPLDLPAGQSVLELELCRGNRPLQASLRLADAAGRPLSGAVLGVPTAGTPVRSSHGKTGKSVAARAAAKPVPAERGGLLFAEARRGDPEATAVLAEQLTPFDDQDRRPIREREAACKTQPRAGGDAGLRPGRRSYSSRACFLRLAHDEEVVGDKGARRAALDAATRSEPAATAALEIDESRYAADLGYPDRALLHARQAVKLDPDDSRAALVLSQALEALGMNGLAGRVDLAGAERWPESPEMLSAASYRLERLHREDDALELLRREVALRDDLLGAHEALERLLLRRRNLDGALDQLAAIRRLIPSSPRSYVEEGKLLLANTEPGLENARSTLRRTRAEQAFEIALALAPASADVWGEIAAADLRDGDLTRGHAALAAALALAPQTPALRALAEGEELREDPFAEGELQDLRTVAAAAAPSPGADAVALGETTVVKVYDSGLSSRVHQSIIRVQSERGAQAARTVPIDYVPDRQDLRIETARILKPNGDIVPSYQETSRSLSEPWYDLYYDLREDDLTFPGLAAGDVLEVTYRLDDSAHENLLARDYGDLVFLQDTIERRRFAYTVVMPRGRELFSNRPAAPGFMHAVAEQPDGSKIHRFIASDLPRLDAEPDMPGYAEFAPYLHVSTQQSWAAVGDYYWSLARDQLAPSPALIEAAHKIAERTGADPAARVAAAYDLVVSQTRYVGLELGIHGYKPYPVGEVLARGFGDCKDKASLLVSLLRELGVPSNLVLLRTRHQGNIEPEPASLSVFDHAIVYVPSLDRYLDGTARFYGARELPSEDQGATALIVEADGRSRLVRTPIAAAATNLTDTELTFQLVRAGPEQLTARVAGKSVITGERAPDYRRAYASAIGQKGAFETAWSRSYPGLSVETLSFSDLDKLEQPVEMTFSLTAPKLALQPNQFRPFGVVSGYLETYAPLSRRRFDLLLDYPFATRFRYRCVPPAGERLTPPADVHLASKFGSLGVTYQVGADGSVLVSGELDMEASRIAPASYADFRDFLRRVDQAFETPVSVGKEAHAAR